jgi:DNA polymerase zeta
LRLPAGLVDLIYKHDGLNISPNGCMFVKSTIRKSILAKMLDELLSTRQAVKEVIKLFSDDAELSKLYDARQLALKLIANVTYGYTSATFSGRMPNSDVADAIVSSGREILMKSIEMIDSGDYGAKVVYGDTDSLFVYFPGKSRADAFDLGRRIAATVTEMFPAPIKLKFEKVYHPCVLLAKKRYVGYSFEKEDQKEPKFDAKGIETIRRDGIPAQQKMVEKTLRILFDTANVSKVKAYTLNQFHKILLNRISLSDFCFAKEVRYGTYKSKTHLPPGAIIAEKLVEKDPRREPQYKERVPYVVVFDPKKTRIKDRVMTPEDFMDSYCTDNPLILDYDYYITRVLIPPIARIFNLIGADIGAWYRELPKYSQLRMNGVSMFNENFVTSYLTSVSCFICGANLVENCGISKFICNTCSRNEIELISYVKLRSKQVEQKIITTEKVCQACVSHNFGEFGTGSAHFFGDTCGNRACSVYYRKFKLRNENSKLQERNSIILNGFNW